MSGCRVFGRGERKGARGGPILSTTTAGSHVADTLLFTKRQDYRCLAVWPNGAPRMGSTDAPLCILVSSRATPMGVTDSTEKHKKQKHTTQNTERRGGPSGQCDAGSHHPSTAVTRCDHPGKLQRVLTGLAYEVFDVLDGSCQQALVYHLDDTAGRHSNCGQRQLRSSKTLHEAQRRDSITASLHPHAVAVLATESSRDFTT